MEYCFTATSAFIARLINPFLMGIAHGASFFQTSGPTRSSKLTLCRLSGRSLARSSVLGFYQLAPGVGQLVDAHVPVEFVGCDDPLLGFRSVRDRHRLYGFQNVSFSLRSCDVFPKLIVMHSPACGLQAGRCRRTCPSHGRHEPLHGDQ
jgi:hypothetical protein